MVQIARLILFVALARASHYCGDTKTEACSDRASSCADDFDCGSGFCFPCSSPAPAPPTEAPTPAAATASQYCGNTGTKACSTRARSCDDDFDCDGGDFCFPCSGPAPPTKAPTSPAPSDPTPSPTSPTKAPTSPAPSDPTPSPTSPTKAPTDPVSPTKSPTEPDSPTKSPTTPSPMPNRPLYVSYVFMNDLKKSLESATARPDVVNLGFGFPGVDHDLTVASIEKGFSDSGTTFNIADIKDAQAQGTKVLASMGGWGFRRQMSQALGDFDHGGWFHTLADKIVLFVDKYGLDGIDIDMEFDTLRPATDDDVEAVYLFMHTLKKQLKHKLITYTIQTPLDKNDEIVKKIATALGAAKPIVDWINVMEYNSPSIGKSKNARIGDIERYVNDLHIPRDRLVLGLMPGFNDDLSECTSAKDVLSLTKYVLENHDGGRLRGVMTWYMNNDKPEYTGMASNGDVGKLIKNTLLADYSSTSFLRDADGAFSTEEDLPTMCPKPPSAGQCNGGDGTDDYTKKMKCKQCSSDAMCGDGGKCWKSVPKCPAPGSPTPAPTKAPTPSGGGGGGGYYCNWSHPSGPRCEKDDAGTKTSDECGDVCHGTCSNKASTCDPTNDVCCPGLSCHHDATFGGLCVVPAGGDDDGSGPSPSPGGEGKTGCYVVQKGDSCARIAAHFKTQEGDIKGDQDLHGAACDDIRGDGSLWAGDKLTITQAHDNTGDMDWKDGACPICHNYYVRSGDTCYKIEAAWGGVYDGDITNSRGEHCPGLSSSLQVGEKLKICGGTPPGALAVGALRGRSSSSSGGAPVEWMALVARWGRRAVAAGQWR